MSFYVHYLIKNQNFGAVAFARLGEPLTDLVYYRRVSHICNGVMVVRKSALDKMRFDLTAIPGGLPDCFSVGLSLSQAGYSYGYLDSIKRVEHMEKHRGLYV